MRKKNSRFFSPPATVRASNRYSSPARCGQPVYPEPKRTDPGADAAPATSPEPFSGRGLKPLSHGFVMDHLRFPVGGKAGAEQSQLRNLLQTLTQWGLTPDLQRQQDHALCSGAVLNLLTLQARNFRDDRVVQLRGWTGRQVLCCAQQLCVDPAEPGRCRKEARDRCFDGAATFYPAPTAQTPPLQGVALNGWLSVGPGALPLVFALPGAGKVAVSLRQATVRGTLTHDRIVDGVLRGGIHETDYYDVVCPAVAKMIFDGYRRASDKLTRQAAVSLLDTNLSGTITDDEIGCKGNLLEHLVRPDWDHDGDGHGELFSVSLGFSAVKAGVQIVF